MLRPLNVKGCYITELRFNVANCNTYSDFIWVFGDNEKRFGNGGQAVIRQCPNSIGIRTKKFPHSLDNAFWTDDEYDANVKLIDEDISNIKAALHQGLSVIFSSNGYGNGLAELPTRAPKTYTYLITQLNTNFGTNYV